MVGRLYLPADDGQYCGVVVLGGSGGGLRWSADVAAELASSGYAALALAYFGLPSLPKTLLNIELQYFETAFDWMLRHSSVRGSRIALVGASRGAELALQLGATFSMVAPVVGYAPSSVRWGPVGGLATVGKPAWRWRGDPLPQMPQPPLGSLAIELGKRAASMVFRTTYRETPAFETALTDVRAVEAATIPVEHICGPVLLISGTDDQLWPATMMSEMICDRLKANHHSFECRHLKFQGAGHAIGLPAQPLECYPTTMRRGIAAVTYALGGDPGTNASAAEQAWREVQTFLATHTAKC